jgi:diaminohydroxyphosphoribosylaminopyrimidine deaminase/5-amino-6-(5-phosphoribosylamino)uracil reductase
MAASKTSHKNDQQATELFAGRAIDQHWMREALRLASLGLGLVEPNPMVGCVIVKPDGGQGRLVGAGYHEAFGRAHAEVNAIATAGDETVGATAYVTLEPCAHQGKTGPCVDALIRAQVARVVVASEDPYAKVAGQGIARLRNAGIEVETNVCESEAIELLAPYLKKITTGIPWMIAKWAMTWDGKIATRTGDSQWISNEQSRELVHQLRGRVDGIMIGAGTARIDDPRLTARPPGSRKAARIVIDSTASLRLDSQLVRTATDCPVLLCTSDLADKSKCQQLKAAGVELWSGSANDRNQRLLEFLRYLGGRDFTNVLVEGGGELLGSLLELDQIDEIHCFIGPKLVGGQDAKTPLGSRGIELMSLARNIRLQKVEQLGDDVYLIGRV